MTCNTCNECDPCDKEKKSCCELKAIAGDCVDVEEVDWQYIISATCPPRVRPGDNVDVEITESWVDGYSKDYTVSAKNDKVSVCSDDDNPGPLDIKIRAQSPIEVTTVWCGDSDGHLLISLDEDALDTPDEKVAVRKSCRPVYLEDAIEVDSQLIEANVVDCKLRFTDRETTYYNNNICLWFDWSREKTIWVDSDWNAVDATWINFWNRYTWNIDMATRDWIKILEDWYYRIFWQLTVQNNTWATDARNRWINLWRWLLKIENLEDAGRKFILSTAKHWQYARQVILRWGKWVKIDWNGEISLLLNNWVPQTWEWPWEWTWQNWSSVQWPWMTFNMDAYVDLKAWDIITVWYRPQSDMPESQDRPDEPAKTFYFIFTWEDDQSTEFQAVFWWTVIWVQMVAPKWFTDWNAYWTF